MEQQKQTSSRATSAGSSYISHRSHTEDAASVEQLVLTYKKQVESRFGNIDLPLLLETASVPVTIMAPDGTICGFAAFSDTAPSWAFPGLSLGSNSASTWSQQHKSLWTAAFVSDPLREKKVSREALRAAFIQCPEIDEIFLALPRTVPHNDSPFLMMFADSKVTPRGISVSEGSVRIMSCNRSEIAPKLVIRPARVEDHDDLVPIFNSQSDLDKRVHEKFFLARVIEGQDKTNKAFVAEHKGRAAGIACVSADVQRQELTDAFLDLAAFTGEQGTTEGADQYLLSKAICLTLFCLSSKFSHRSSDFLKPIFDQFPDKDYLLLTQPFTSPTSLLLRYFVQVPPRPHSNFGHVLYVLTRSAFSGVLTVKRAVPDDITSVSKLFQQQVILEGSLIPPPLIGQSKEDASKESTTRFQDALDSEGKRVPFIVSDGTNVIGAAVIDRLDNDRVQSMFDKFDLDVYIPGLPLELGEEYGLLSLLCLDPKYQTRTSSILSAMMSAPCSAILLEVGNNRRSGGPMLGNFYPAKIRRQPSPIALCKEPTNSALFVCTGRLLLEPRKCINNRIVVVGASSVGISFIDTLLNMPDVMFPHVTLVSPEGIPPPEQHMSFSTCHAPQFAPLSCNYFCGELQSTAMHSRIKVYNSKMIEIDRTDKVVFLSNNEAVSYDQLVIANGQQALVPEGASGVFNDPSSNQHGLTTIAAYLATLGRQARAVVYGPELSAVSIVSSLLSLGNVSVSLVRPQSSNQWPSVVGDEVLSKKVSESLQSAQVEIFEPFSLTKIETAPETGAILSCQITRDEQQNTIPCDVLILCTPKQTDSMAFEAINMSCLVYDNKLVVDKDFVTNDPSIFAAGSLTKYARTLGDHSHMTSWNSREIGQQLAASLLQKTGHFVSGVPLKPPQRSVYGTIKFSSPLCEGAVLPDGLYYYHCQLPVIPSGGRSMSTNAPGRPYINLHYGTSGKFDCITYIGKEHPDVDNLRNLIGLPNTALNNIVERFDAGLIPDLTTFLREPWTAVLYHDRFSFFFDDLCNTLQAWLGPKASDLSPLDTKASNAVSEYLASFIGTNHTQLPQYSVPSL